MYLQADGNHTILHFSGLNKIVANLTLNEFERILANQEFFRIHKSTIINMNYLKVYSRNEEDAAVLTDGTQLAISRRKLSEFREAIKRFSKPVD